MPGDYRDAYDGSDMSDEHIIEEIICDANGGMNIFAEANDILARKFAPQLEAVKSETEKSKNNQPNAPPDKRALKLSREIPIRRDFISEEEQKRIRSDRHYLSKQFNNWLKTKTIVHLPEVAEVSRFVNESNLHNHQWLDEHGWEFRDAYVQDTDGKIIKPHQTSDREEIEILCMWLNP